MHFQNIVHYKKCSEIWQLPTSCWINLFFFEFEFVALKSAGRSLGRRKNCLERCQSSEDGTSTFVALVHWMDETTLVCEELLPLSISSVRRTGSPFMSDLNLVCKLHHLFLDKWLTLETKHTCSGRCVFRLSVIPDDTILACLHSCLCLIFAGIPAKYAPGTRTNFNYFLGDLIDADTATYLIDWRWENFHNSRARHRHR